MAMAPFEYCPRYWRAGQIVPTGPAVESTAEAQTDLTILVFTGRDASYSLYEDEGVNYNYEKGKYATIDFSYDEATRTLTIGERKGDFKGMLKQRRFNVVVVNRDNAKALNLENPVGTMVQYNGKQTSIQL